MAIALDCPHCGTRKVETVRTVWYIQGFLLFARYGSTPYIGCGECTRQKALRDLAISGLLGWWCFPWGIGTPFVIAQNLLAVIGGNDERALAGLLSKQGLDIEDFRMDAQGRALGDRRLVEAVLTTMHRMTWADGSADPREIEVGSLIAVQVLGDMVTAEEAQSALASRTPPGRLDAQQLSPDGQLLLMRAAHAVAQADGVIEHSELVELRALGRELGLSAELVQPFLDALSSPEQAHAAAEAAEAAQLLQVSADAPLAEVRAAYQQRVAEAAQTVPPAELAAYREACSAALYVLLSR